MVHKDNSSAGDAQAEAPPASDGQPVATPTYPLAEATHVPVTVARQLKEAYADLASAQARLTAITQTLASIYGLADTSMINFDTGEIQR